jgi:hypothetical protein
VIHVCGEVFLSFSPFHLCLIHLTTMFWTTYGLKSKPLTWIYNVFRVHEVTSSKSHVVGKAKERCESLNCKLDWVQGYEEPIKCGDICVVTYISQ